MTEGREDAHDRPLYYNRAGEPISLVEWSDGYRENRWVAVTNLPSGHSVRTIWIGLDDDRDGGPPLIFGTVVQGPDGTWEDTETRYATEDDAKAGHTVIVEGLRRE